MTWKGEEILGEIKEVKSENNPAETNDNQGHLDSLSTFQSDAVVQEIIFPKKHKPKRKKLIQQYSKQRVQQCLDKLSLPEKSFGYFKSESVETTKTVKVENTNVNKSNNIEIILKECAESVPQEASDEVFVKTKEREESVQAMNKREICRMGIPVKDAIESETEFDSIIQIYKCKICSDVFKDVKRFRKHKMQHKEFTTKRLHCPWCDAVFKNRNTFYNHKKWHRRSKVGEEGHIELSKLEESTTNFSCNLCEFISNHQTKFRKHIQSVHNDKSLSIFKCEQCHRKLPCESKLIQHKLLHAPPSLPCKHCNKILHTDNLLNQHIRLIHTPDDQKPLRCDQCGKGFMRYSTLEDHVNIHTGNKPFMCSHCVNCYSNSSNLSNHIKEKHPENYRPGRVRIHKSPNSVRALKAQKKLLSESHGQQDG